MIQSNSANIPDFCKSYLCSLRSFSNPMWLHRCGFESKKSTRRQESEDEIKCGKVERPFGRTGFGWDTSRVTSGASSDSLIVYLFSVSIGTLM
jgi:hypothetical protein